MTVNYYPPQPVPQQPPARPWGRILAIGISVGVVVAVALVLIVVLVSNNSSAAEQAYIDEVAERVEVSDQDRQAFIDAGEKLCGVAGDDAAVDSRQVLADFHLARFANEWVFISAAASNHLC